ncbi:hypothetical protein ACFYW9_41090 [Streptomyces sp. NPDC002698]|uniref:hypothetical protein n=1 Tax=Streptomyces sp. NPDC002698 TaxID=3364660 RepID=UPI00367AEBD0
MTYTDHKGRTPEQRVADTVRAGSFVTQGQRDRATLLLTDLLAAADRHGVTLDDFDWSIDLPGGCLDAIVTKDHGAHTE